MRQKKRDTLPLSAARPAVRRTLRGAPTALHVIGSGRDVPLPHDVTRFGIGSDATNNLVIDDRYVSAFHCLLERSGAKLLLRDRESRNGTYVNGARVQVSEVEAGTRISLGDTALAVLADGAPRPAVASLLGDDPELRRVLDLAQRAAATNATVLFIGESGSGKELAARLVHESSPRAAGPFVAVNCGAIPRDLLESELFGHERGAFTGAHDRHAGVFEQAHGGTLFLDEIGELPIQQQPRLLRALENRAIRRVGGDREIEVDVRVVAATHLDLAAASASGTFRLDLYHRLCAVELRLPPLRERRGDIPKLVQTFLAEAAFEHGVARISRATLDALQRHSWPGNVRELRNAVHRAALLGDGELRIEHLIPRRAVLGVPLPPLPGLMARDPGLTARDGEPAAGLSPDDVTRAMIERALARYGSTRRAAASLGMSKSTFHDRARRYGLIAPARASDP